MPEGEKFDRIPSSAGWLHVCAILYAARGRTDGFVSVERVYQLTNDSRFVVNGAIGWLTRPRRPGLNPLWEKVEGGWQIHDYLDPAYGNPTKSEGAAIREQRSSAGSRGGVASAKSRREKYGTAQPFASSGPEAHPEAEPEAPRPSSPLTSLETRAPRAEVDGLCEHLSRLLDGLDVRHTVTPTWRHEAAMLLVRDQRPYGEALELLTWALGDEFWRRNIHSLPTFRAKYDRLRLDRDGARRPRHKPGSVDDRVQRLLTEGAKR